MVTFKDLTEDQKEVLYEILNDLNEGIKEEFVMENHKRDVLDKDGNRNYELADWMVFNAQSDDDVIEWYDNKVENDHEDYEVDKLANDIVNLSPDQRSKLYASIGVVEK